MRTIIASAHSPSKRVRAESRVREEKYKILDQNGSSIETGRNNALDALKTLEYLIDAHSSTIENVPLTPVLLFLLKYQCC